MYVTVHDKVVGPVFPAVDKPGVGRDNMPSGWTRSLTRLDNRRSVGRTADQERRVPLAGAPDRSAPSSLGVAMFDLQETGAALGQSPAAGRDPV